MKKNLYKIITLALLLILLVWIILASSKEEQSTVTIGDNVFKVDVARSDKDLSKGLSGRSSIEDDEAMLFLFGNRQARTFWMKDMEFNIDLLWIDGNDIVGYEKNMQAPTKDTSNSDLEQYYSDREIDKVIEMNAGLIDRLGIEIGDKIKIN